MSIIGLTDQAAALPIIGALRKGEKKVDEKKPGKDLTYFRFTTDDSLAMKMFTEAYPDQDALRTINIYLPHKTTDENIDAWIEEWVAGGLVHRCDGVNQVLWRTPAGGYETGSRPCQNCKGKQVGRLSVIVPELGRLATVTVLTTSVHDIINLTRQLRSYESMSGDLRGITFTLRRRKQQISTPAPDGKRVRREKWLLSIETQPRWTMLQFAAMERKALPVVDIIDQETGEIMAIPANVPLPDNPFDEGDFEPESEEPAAPSDKPTNGKEKRSRPMTPEDLKDALVVKAAKHAGPATPEQMDYLASSLSKACGGDNTKRHTVTKYLVGRESLKDDGWTKGEASALIDWIGAKAENEYAPNPDSIKEIELIIRQFQVEAGQADMFDQPADDDELPF